MTREQFDQLVQLIQKRHEGNTAGLRRQTLFYALLGYAGLLAWFFIFILIATGFFIAAAWSDDPVGKLMGGGIGLFVLFGGGSLALHTLLTKVAPPTGLILRPDDAPKLFAEIEQLRSVLRCPRFHEIRLTSECNAGVVQRPLLGWLGWSRNHLLIGLPLLDGLAPEEFRSVLAHELAHLSRADARLAHWLYRLRRSWETLMQQPERSRPRQSLSLHTLTDRFIDWFWPRFNARAFVLSRAQEYEADRQASHMAGATSSASALIRLNYLTNLLEKNIWSTIWQLANHHPTPPPDIFIALRDGLRTGAAPEDCLRWSREALSTTTTNLNTHPCLADRLAALGMAPAFAPGLSVVASPSAAEIYLGPGQEKLRHELSIAWQKEIAETWSERHARASSLAHRIASIDQVSQSAGSDADSLWEKAVAHLRLQGDDTIEPLLQQILVLRPDHPPANFHLGRIRLEAGQAEGEALMERAIMLDETLLGSAARVLHDYYRRTGQTDRLRQLAARLDQHESIQVAANNERTTITASDTFRSHGLTDKELRTLLETLTAEPEFHRAHLLQKTVRHLATQRLFVLCVQASPGRFGLPRFEVQHALAQRLAQKVRLPGRVFVFAPAGSNRSLAKKLQRTPRACIWPG